MKIKFDGKVLVIGCGGVSQCFLPMLIKHIDMPLNKITVIDPIDKTKPIKNVLAQGVVFKQARITRDGLAKELSSYVGSGDIVIDLAWNIECIDILQWCHDNNVRYINTSTEEWDSAASAEHPSLYRRTLYYRQVKIRELIDSWKGLGPSAVYDHGANPGLVSHFVKVALVDIANKLLEDKPKDKRAADLKEYLQTENWPKLSQTLGVKVIHISERDTQIVNKPKQLNEFVNTWSIDGFFEESLATSELGWGTHETNLPPNAITFDFGPLNQVGMTQMGMKTKVRSWVPCGEIVGMAIRHSETFSISDFLTVWNNQKPVYRPTVNFAYCPSDSAQASIAELEMRQFKVQEKQRIVNDEIISGRDELGVLLMGHDYKSWWTGSLLDIETTRKLAPNQNATTLQVATGVLGALFWLIRHPQEGAKYPDQLPYKEVMEAAKPYLGEFISLAVNWDPTQNRKDITTFNNFRTQPRELNENLMWQFNTFLVE